MTDLVISLSEQLEKVIKDIAANRLQTDFTNKSIKSAKSRQATARRNSRQNSFRSLGSSISRMRAQLPILRDVLAELEAKKTELEMLLIDAQENAVEIIEETQTQVIKENGNLIKVAAGVVLLAVLS